MKTAELRRFVKYCMVGVLNTLVTMGVIFTCKSVLELNPYLSNALGYVAGVINSFLWNKTWVFHSDGSYHSEALRFVAGFLVCYALQFAVVVAMTSTSFADVTVDLRWVVLSGYGIATVLGNVVYTMANFIYNRTVTFSPGVPA